MIRYEIVDVCQPIGDITAERKTLEQQGFVLVDQYGGGDLGSSLVYADYKHASKEEQEDIMRRHRNHIARCSIAQIAMANMDYTK